MFGLGGIIEQWHRSSPSGVLDRFKDMSVQAGGENVSVAVNKYRNNDGGSHPTPGDGGTQDAIKIKDALMGLAMGDVLARAGGAQSYVDVFTGKGSPEGIAAVMVLFHDYSDKFIERYKKSGGATRVCADILANPDMTWQATLQAISDEFIGLDCNGFVGNWLKSCEPNFRLGPQNGPRQVYDKRKTQRNSVDEIEYWDVVVWANFSHIAAVDGVSGGGLPKVNVCQSAGGGPRMNEYTILQAAPGMFQLSGGGVDPAWEVGGGVYIVSLW